MRLCSFGCTSSHRASLISPSGHIGCSFVRHSYDGTLRRKCDRWTRHDALAERFEANRPTYRAVAYRMLGSRDRGGRRGPGSVAAAQPLRHGRRREPGRWLTTVVARVCLDMLRSRKSRREEPLERGRARADREPRGHDDPEHEAMLADSVGLALLVVLETLAPAERVAFVLHDMFDLPFDEIAPIVGRSPDCGEAARKPRAPPGAGRGHGSRHGSHPPARGCRLPSSPPPAAVISRRCSRCSTRTSCSARTRAAVQVGAEAEVRGARPWPGPSPAAPASHIRRW